jgi:hypothetical protein
VPALSRASVPLALDSITLALDPIWLHIDARSIPSHADLAPSPTQHLYLISSSFSSFPRLLSLLSTSLSNFDLTRDSDFAHSELISPIISPPGTLLPLGGLNGDLQGPLFARFLAFRHPKTTPNLTAPQPPPLGRYI